MAYLTLYRKYRPTNWNDVIGQRFIVRTLINQVERDQVAHAYLFTGTRGTGKTTSAKIFARAINCLHPVNGSPCGECEVCRALRGEDNLDIIELDAASNNGVEEIRDLTAKVQYPPTAGRYKVYIIDEVHMLSISAFNALLKTLEEPPKHAVFILATTEVHKLPQTILSRCMRFDFRLVPKEELSAHLKRILTAEGVPYDDAACDLVAQQGEGSVRDMLSLADMCLAFSPDKLSESAVYEVLGASDFDTLSSIIGSVLSGDVTSLLTLTETVYNRGKGFQTLNKELSSFIQELIAVKNIPGYKGGFSDAEYAVVKKLADEFDNYRIARVMHILSTGEGELRYSTRPRITFEALLVKAASIYTSEESDAMLSRIEELERKLRSGNFTVRKTETVQKPDPEEIQKRLSDFAKTDTRNPETEISVFSDNPVPVGDERAETLMGQMITELRSQHRMLLYSALNSQNSYFVQGDEFVINAADATAYDMLTEESNLKVLEDAAFRLGGLKLKIIGGASGGKTRHTAEDRVKLYELMGDKLRDKK